MEKNFGFGVEGILWKKEMIIDFLTPLLTLFFILIYCILFEPQHGKYDYLRKRHAESIEDAESIEELD